MQHDLRQLPTDLPRPDDDGACAHLRGQVVPSVRLMATTGERISLTDADASWIVVYVYPRTGVPGVEIPQGWDLIPGARGCTPQSCSYRDAHSDFEELGARLFGLSTQSHAAQVEFAHREHIPFALLSDPERLVGAALNLPTFNAGGEVLYKRTTLVIRDGRIRHVRYPVFPPNEDADQVLRWLRADSAVT